MFKNQGRRAMDRYPVTEPLTLGVLHRIDRVQPSRVRKVNLKNALCFVGAGVIYGGGIWVVVQWFLGA